MVDFYLAKVYVIPSVSLSFSLSHTHFSLSFFESLSFSSSLSSFSLLRDAHSFKQNWRTEAESAISSIVRKLCALRENALFHRYFTVI